MQKKGVSHVTLTRDFLLNYFVIRFFLLLFVYLSVFVCGHTCKSEMQPFSKGV